MYKEIAVAFVVCCVKFIIKYCKQRMLQMKLQANVCANHAECCLDKLTKSKELSKLGDGRMGAYSGQYGAINAAQNLCHFCTIGCILTFMYYTNKVPVNVAEFI